MIVLTKADLTEDTAPYVNTAQAVSEQVPVVTLDACGGEPAKRLDAEAGRTIVIFLSSSGVSEERPLTNAPEIRDPACLKG